jgi:hypothetical protein
MKTWFHKEDGKFFFLAERLLVPNEGIRCTVLILGCLHPVACVKSGYSTVSTGRENSHELRDYILLVKEYVPLC